MNDSTTTTPAKQQQANGGGGGMGGATPLGGGNTAEQQRLTEFETSLMSKFGVSFIQDYPVVLCWTLFYLTFTLLALMPVINPV